MGLGTTQSNRRKEILLGTDIFMISISRGCDSPTYLLPKGTFHKINLNSALTAALPYELRQINSLLYARFFI